MRATRKLSLTFLFIILFATPSLAASPSQIAADYKANPAAALDEYGGKAMSFYGAVKSHKKVFNSHIQLWATRIDAGEVDVLGYITGRQLEESVTLTGTCTGFQLAGDRVTIVLYGATVQEEF
jgi:hypothetical protein